MRTSSSFLRRSLQLDGVASGLCGVLLLVAAGPVSAPMGLAGPGVARIVGALPVLYAAALLWNGARATVSRGGALAAVVLNAAWVAGPLTPLGNAAVAAAAPVVLDLGEAGSSTVELTVHVRARPAPGWLACRSTTRFVAGGFHEEDFEIWDSTGALVAQSRQLALLP